MFASLQFRKKNNIKALALLCLDNVQLMAHIISIARGAFAAPVGVYTTEPCAAPGGVYITGA